MYFYIALGCILLTGIGVILVVALTIERDTSNYRRSLDYEDEV